MPVGSGDLFGVGEVLPMQQAAPRKSGIQTLRRAVPNRRKASRVLWLQLLSARLSHMEDAEQSRYGEAKISLKSCQTIVQLVMQRLNRPETWRNLQFVGDAVKPTINKRRKL